MQSSFSIFPATKKSLDATKINFVLYVQPILEELPDVEIEKFQVPRCTNSNCTSYFSGMCQYSSKSWICPVCGQRNSFNKLHSIPSFLTSTPSFQIVDQSVTFPLTHVVIIGCGDISPARAVMQSLPPNAPVQIFVMSTTDSARKLVTIAGNSAQLKKLPPTSVRAQFSSALPLLQTLLNQKKSCFWCRVFCCGGTIDEKALGKLKLFDRIPIRIDFYVDSPIQTNTQNFAELVPGIYRVFPSFLNTVAIDSACDIASSDCARSFGFQCKVIVRCGPNFKATCDNDKATLPVIASTRACVPFIITPPTTDMKLSFQAVQVHAHVHIWDPPTNTLRKCTNVLNADFPVSNDVSLLTSSISPSALFDYLCRHGQLKLIESIKPTSENLKALHDMLANSKKFDQFNDFKSEFFALCIPSTWSLILNTFTEEIKDPDTDKSAIIIYKKFPTIMFYLKEDVDVLLGDNIRNFVEMCKPLVVKVQQVSFGEIKSLIKDHAK